MLKVAQKVTIYIIYKEYGMRYLNKLLATGVLLVATTIMSFALKAEYRFEKCDGSASLENHAGNTLVGELSGDANISLGDGKIINALSLSGDGMMSVEHSTELDIVGDLTIAFWIKPSEIKKQALVTRGFGTGTGRKYASNAEYFIKMNSTGQLVYRHSFVESNGSVIAYSDTNLSTDEWTHVVFTRDNSAKTMRFYINGVANSEYSYTVDPKSSHTEKLVIGQCDGCVNPDKFSGKLDEIKLYSIALSESDISALYNTEDGGAYATGGCHPAPLALDDSADLPFAGTVTVDILSNDRTNDSATCAVDASTVMIRSNPTDSNLSDDNKTLTVTGEGSWSVDDNGTITFVSISSFIGNPTDINYTVSDSCANLSNQAVVSLTRVANSGGNTGGGSSGGSGEGSSWSSGGDSSLDATPSSTPDKNITLGDMVWYDIDKDGIQDSTEQGVADVTVVLFDVDGNVVKRTTTNVDGIYQFTDVVAGTYSIGFSNLPTDYIFTSQNMGSSDAQDSDVDSSGRTAKFSVGNVENDLIYDAGIVPTTEPSVTIRPSVDENITAPVKECNCDNYKSTIPSMNVIGLVAIWLLVSLLGVLFLRGDEFNFNKK
jgi:hypothetical protein